MSPQGVHVKAPNLAFHLQSPEFLDAERFPLLSFETNEVSRSGNEFQFGL